MKLSRTKTTGIWLWISIKMIIDARGERQPSWENTIRKHIKIRCIKCKEVLFGITFNSKIPEMLMLQSDTLREGEKKTWNEIYFSDRSGSRQCCTWSPKTTSILETFNKFPPFNFSSWIFSRVEPIYEDSYEIKAKIFSTLLLIIYPSISLFTGSQLEYT